MRFGAAFAVLGILILSACSGSGGSGGFVQLDGPPYECRQGAIGDDDAIANEILGEASRDPTFDRDERDDLGDRVHEVLDVVRDEFPVVQELHAPPNDRWQLFVEPGPEFRQRVLDQAKTYDGDFYVEKTGDAHLDELNEELGLYAMRFKWHTPDQSVYAQACLSDSANTRIAAEAYANLDSIDNAYPVPFAGDSSRIDMRERDGTWFVVTRMADPVDPQSGCSDGPLLFLRSEDGAIEEVKEDEAMRDATFVGVLDLVGCHSYFRWPYATPAP